MRQTVTHPNAPGQQKSRNYAVVLPNEVTWSTKAKGFNDLTTRGKVFINKRRYTQPIGMFEAFSKFMMGI
jgi:hypothetical protein